MSRPTVSVVMPFAGDGAAAREAIRALGSLEIQPGDEVILADNSGTAPDGEVVTVIRALGERSPAHARNAGAERSHGEWILFVDADCRLPADLVDAYFAEPVGEQVGALAGEVVPAADGRTFAERYGAARSFLSQEKHLAHPFLPRAVAANLLVRRAAYEQVGGFHEGLRAAEDTDFSWRLQQAGWQLELRPLASVEHHYRATVRELRAQWRGYAAGRAWLRRRYRGFAPEPAAKRALRRLWRARGARAGAGRASTGRQPKPGGGLERARYLALDGLLGFEELTGLALSNRPRRSPDRAPAAVVLVADQFPAPGDPLADFATALERARVEASRRPEAAAPAVARGLEIAYREDDGALERLLALARLVLRHPVRVGRDLLRGVQGEPSLTSLAPAALRLLQSPRARLHPLGGEQAHAVAARLARLSGRSLDEPRRR